MKEKRDFGLDYAQLGIESERRVVLGNASFANITGLKVN